MNGKTSQWEQAIAVQNAMNAKIAAAVGSVQQWAKTQQGISPGNIQMAVPDQREWQKHQAKDKDPWVFANDTWIHPSKAGHTQLAKTVTSKMCSSFGQWCGAQPAWDTTPVVRSGNADQELKGKVPAKVRNKKMVDLPTRTRQGTPVSWVSRKAKICKVFEGDLVTSRKDGKCKLKAFAAASDEFAPLKESHTVKVR